MIQWLRRKCNDGFTQNDRDSESREAAFVTLFPEFGSHRDTSDLKTWHLVYLRLANNYAERDTDLMSPPRSTKEHYSFSYQCPLQPFEGSFLMRFQIYKETTTTSLLHIEVIIKNKKKSWFQWEHLDLGFSPLCYAWFFTLTLKFLTQLMSPFLIPCRLTGY